MVERPTSYREMSRARFLEDEEEWYEGIKEDDFIFKDSMRNDCFIVLGKSTVFEVEGENARRAALIISETVKEYRL